MRAAAPARRNLLALVALGALAAGSGAHAAEPSPTAKDTPARAAASTCVEDDGQCAEVERLRKPCDAGDGAACARLGWHLLSGEGVRARDDAAGAMLTERACTLGDVHGCANLAGLLFDGTGLAKDPPRALAVAERACEGGSAHGCSLAGTWLLSGEIGEADAPRAVPLLERGCAKGYASACEDLAVALAKGDGIPRDRPRALRLAAAACETRSGGCEVLFRIATLEGTTLEEILEARKLLAGACARGDQTACARAEWLEPIERKRGSRR